MATETKDTVIAPGDIERPSALDASASPYINIRNIPTYIRMLSPPMVFGSCLLWVWVYAIIFASFPIIDSLYTPLLIISNTLNPLPTIVFLAIATCMAVLGRSITYFIRMRSVQICAAVMMAFGTVVLFQSLRLDIYPLTLFSYLILGATAGFFVLIWSEVFRRQETPSIVLNAIFGQTLAFLAFGLLKQFVPGDISVVILSFLPLFQIALLLFALHGLQALMSPQRFEYDATGTRVAAPGLLEIPTFHRLRVRRPFFIVRMGGPSLLFGIAFGPLTCWCFSLLYNINRNIEDGLATITLLAASLIALLLVILLLSVNRTDEYDSFYRFVIPLVSILLFFTSVLSEALPLTMIVFICFILFLFMVWVEFCEMSHRYRISPILVTGTGMGFMMLGMLVGIGLVEALQADRIVASGVGFVTTLMIISLLLGYFLMPRSKAIMEMAIIEDHGTTDVAGSSDQDNTGDNRGRFLRRCEKTANTYLLSNREIDVFYLLAKGRNAAYIAQRLFIAEGTVNTHTWRIYKKLNVHSQQELMELVDNMQLDSE
ncbi:MAG: helix-turn-helix transcriptional regulator [Coriobacteriales bacterium]|nr:helix-turn-helix transcriptional regulator [Coriobacteriales bacterium]